MTHNVNYENSFFYCFFFLYLKALSQTAISGRVTDETGKNLSNVTITVHKKNQLTVLAFDISDREGKFSIQYSSQAGDSLDLTASLLGFTSDTISFLSGSKTAFTFSLHFKAIELKEVKVKNPPVWQRKDTLNYSASEFRQQQDRVIGDIIARLPGMEVSPGGQIKYNGKPINKFYIEGLDLLEDRYGIANNNIPADAVEKVQVLENHQPIQVLDSVQFSDRAALNIKLKDDAKMKVIGRAKIGIGLLPLLGEVEATPMLFKKNFQFITTYKYNNTGLDNTRELSSQNINDYISALQNGAVKNDLVALVTPGHPPLSTQRYLFNNGHVVSGNFLMPVNKNYQLRINTSLVNDYQKQESSVETKFYLPSDTISIKEQNKYHTNLNRLQTDVTLMANQPRYFLKNLLRFQGYWSSERGTIVSTDEIKQRVNNPFFNLSNDFSLLKTKKKQILEWGSYVGYVSLPQQLTVLPGLYESILNNNTPYDALHQEATLKTFYTDNHFSLRKKKSKFGDRHKLGFNIQSQQYTTNLLTDQSGIKKPVADTFQNNLDWQRIRFYSDNEWSYETSKWRLSLTIPFNYTMIRYSDPPKTTRRNNNALLISPSVGAILQIDPKWNWNTSLLYKQEFADINSVIAGYVLKDYRNFFNSNAPLGENKIMVASSSLTFRNPVKIIFYNIGINYSKSKSNLIYRQSFNDNLQTLLAEIMENTADRVSVSSRLSKYFMSIKTSIAINGSFTFGNQQRFQQGQLVKFNNRNYAAGFSLNSKISRNFSTDYTANYNAYLSKAKGQNSSSAIKSGNQKIGLNFLPKESVIFQVSGEHYYVRNNFSGSSNYFFADMSLRFKPKKMRIDMEAGWQNIFNTRNFITTYLSNNIETASYIQLRPRQFLLKLSFPF